MMQYKQHLIWNGSGVAVAPKTLTDDSGSYIIQLKALQATLHAVQLTTHHPTS